MTDTTIDNTTAIDLARKAKELLESAVKEAQSAEVLGLSRRGKTLFLANGGFTDIHNYNLEEASLRVIKEGKIGSTYSNLNNAPDEITEKALLSAKFGPTATFEFTTPKEAATVIDSDTATNSKSSANDSANDSGTDNGSRAEIYSKDCAELTADWLAEEAKRIFDYLRSKSDDIQFNVQLDVEERHVYYCNSSGREDSYKRTRLTSYVQHIFEGSKEGIEKMEVSCKPFKLNNALLDAIIREREAMSKVSTSLTGGPTQVLFLPGSAWTLVLRLANGVTGNTVARKLSPLTEKMNEKIFSDKVTILEAPDRDFEPGSIPFDDEGMPTKARAIVENGILKDFIYDKKSAQKGEVKSTGNGLKRIMWGDGIQHSPAPYFANLVMNGGSKTIKDIIAGMKNGIVVCDVVGFHSGNILAGHYSMGIGSGFHVIDGKPFGRLLDTMIAGNIYDDFNNIAELSQETSPTLVGRVPAILINDIQVSTKS